MQASKYSSEKWTSPKEIDQSGISNIRKISQKHECLEAKSNPITGSRFQCINVSRAWLTGGAMVTKKLQPGVYEGDTHWP